MDIFSCFDNFTLFLICFLKNYFMKRYESILSFIPSNEIKMCQYFCLCLVSEYDRINEDTHTLYESHQDLQLIIA